MTLKKLVLLLPLVLIISCGTKAPPVSFCIFDGVSLFYCTDPKGVQTTVSLQAARKYVCESSKDAQILLTYVHQLESDLASCQGRWMANIYQMDQYLSIHDKWKIAKTYYERVLSTKEKKVILSRKPSDDQVEDLFQKIGKLNSEAQEHFFKKPGSYKNFLEFSGLTPELDLKSEWFDDSPYNRILVFAHFRFVWHSADCTAYKRIHLLIK